MSEPPGARLDSWKEIAAYLGRTERTVRRWESERGMPVHRVPGGRGASAFAYSDELDRWLAAAQQPSQPEPSQPETTPGEQPRGPRPRRQRYLAAALMAVVALAALVTWRTRVATGAQLVQQVTLDRNVLTAVDDRGQPVWRYTFGDRSEPAGVRWNYVGPADHGANQLVVVSVDRVTASGEYAGALWAFDGSGRVLWRLAPGDKFEFPSGEYGPPWCAGGGDLLSFEVGRERLFAWAVHHQTWWPSFVAVVDGSGHVRSRFVNAGWISRLMLSRDGRFLLAAGVNNTLDEPIVAVLDANRPSGASPDAQASACRGCPAGRPYRYLTFARSDISRATQFRLRSPITASLDGRIEIRVQENDEEPPAESIYEFSSGLQLLRASRSDTYWEWRRRLAPSLLLTGKDPSGAPEPGRMVVRAWDARHGWWLERPAGAPATTATDR